MELFAGEARLSGVRSDRGLRRVHRYGRCDKRFATCRDRFANGINFRGFPAIPGNDFVISYPVPGRGSG